MYLENAQCKYIFYKFLNMYIYKIYMLCFLTAWFYLSPLPHPMMCLHSSRFVLKEIVKGQGKKEVY